MSFIYLAAPYTHEDPAIVALRMQQVEEVTCMFFRSQTPVYSPLVSWHDLALKYKLPNDYRAYRIQNLACIRACSELLVLDLTGWNNSLGVQWEIEEAQDRNIPVNLYHWNQTNQCIFKVRSL